MADLRIDPAKSHLRVETRAKGMLAKLAHDLSIEGAAPTGTCRLDGGRFTLDLELPVAALRVAGVRKGGRVETSVLSRSDLDDIHRKIRDEVLAGRSTIAVHAEGAVAEPPQGTFRVTGIVVKAARGEQRVSSDVTVVRDGERLVVTGMAQVSLEALKIPPVKAPLGAFRVDDTIDVHVHVELAGG